MFEVVVHIGIGLAALLLSHHWSKINRENKRPPAPYGVWYMDEDGGPLPLIEIIKAFRPVLAAIVGIWSLVMAGILINLGWS